MHSPHPAPRHRPSRKTGQLSAGASRWLGVILASGGLLTLNIVLPSLSGQELSAEELGLFGNEYLNPQNLGSTSISAFNTAGYVGGYNLRYGGGGISLGQDAWLAETSTGLSLQVGLTANDGAEFENAVALPGYATGHRQSVVEYLSGSGFAAGTSNTYNNTDFLTDGAGKAVWVANAATGQTLRVGLTGTGFTKTTGFVMSILSGITHQGETWGISNLYDAGNNSDGEAAWAADSSGNTIRVGFYGLNSGYQRSGSNEEFSRVTGITTSGYAAGSSTRYDGTSFRGQQTWVQNIRLPGSTPTAIGLGLGDGPGTEFASLNNTRNHTLIPMTGGDYIGGSSTRYGLNSNTTNGQAAWVHTIGGTTLRVGFLGADFTSGTNFQQSTLVRISNNGIAVGTSQRVTPTTVFNGKATFVTNVPTNTTVEAGLKTGIFRSTAPTLPYDNIPVYVSDSGWVVGTAQRYSGSTLNGIATWVASASTGNTYQVGLTAANSPEFASSTTGFETNAFSTKAKLTESGYVGGSVNTYVGGSIAGKAAWIAKASDHSTSRVGLFGAAGTLYKSTTGVQLSEVEYLTESGYAAGYSSRYLPGDIVDPGSLGSTSWIYHIPTGLLTPIQISIRPNNYSYTRILALYESGLALGTYELYSPAGLSLGDRAFAWTPAEGYYDLGVDLGATLGIDGWASLDNALYADIYGRIVGYGTRLSNSNPGDSAYLLATIPEPSAALLGLIGAGLCGLSRRRRAA